MHERKIHAGFIIALENLAAFFGITPPKKNTYIEVTKDYER